MRRANRARAGTDRLLEPPEVGLGGHVRDGDGESAPMFVRLYIVLLSFHGDFA